MGDVSNPANAGKVVLKCACPMADARDCIRVRYSRPFDGDTFDGDGLEEPCCCSCHDDALFDGDGVPVAMATGRERAKADSGFAMFALLMSRGPCLCEDIDPSDRPCLTCEAVEASPPPSVKP